MESNYPNIYTSGRGQVEYNSVGGSFVSVPGPSSFCASLGKAKKKKVSRCPVKLPRRFEFVSPPETLQNGPKL